MKLNEIAQKATGTFVGVKFDKESEQKLLDACEKLAIPNPIDREDLHITVIYSKKPLENFQALGKLDEPIKAKAKKLSIFESANGNNCLVVELTCDDLTKRHKHIRKVHGATHDYDDYKCHVTLSYDVDDYDISSRALPRPLKSLLIESEYSEELKKEW